jgi:ribosomal-protein-alanine N-acetyltransferase
MRKLREEVGGALFDIRVMTQDDLEGVITLERDSFRNPWSPELLRRELHHDWSTILLAEEQGPTPDSTRLLGCIIFWVVHDELHILNVAVASEQRRRGVARALLAAALERGRARHCVLATLEVRRSNIAALELYRAFAFRTVGVRPNYYVDEGEDALVMVLDL